MLNIIGVQGMWLLTWWIKLFGLTLKNNVNHSKKMVFIAYVVNDCPDQIVHFPTLLSAFLAPILNHSVLYNTSMHWDGPSQAVWTFIGHIWHKDIFLVFLVTRNLKEVFLLSDEDAPVTSWGQYGNFIAMIYWATQNRRKHCWRVSKFTRCVYHLHPKYSDTLTPRLALASSD